jgi:hypothetical protein
LGAPFFGLRGGIRAVFGIADPVVEDLPWQTAEPVGGRPNGPLAAEAGNQLSEHELKKGEPFVLTAA